MTIGIIGRKRGMTRVFTEAGEAIPVTVIEALPNLKMMTVTGGMHRTLDLAAASERGIAVCHSMDRPGGSHGSQHAFQMTTREPKHPIMEGLPPQWMHAKDELYDRLRGPAKNLTVLATAFSDPKTRGTGKHEPLLFTITFGQGRVFHTALGHNNGPDLTSQKCIGFITTLLRGTEWAATGRVTLPIPTNFPTATEVRSRE